MEPSNQPMNLTVPPQGHRSRIDGPIRAAVPQVIGRTFDGREHQMTRIAADD